MRTYRRFFEMLLYSLALLLALFARFRGANVLPLGNSEAEWALQALSLSRGENVLLGAVPAYLLPTSMVMFLIGGSNLAARLVPILAGSSLAVLPWFMRSKIGRLASLALAFGLALDPLLVGGSRLAGGPQLAAVFGAWALVLWWTRRKASAGVLLALSLLAGPSVFTGLVAYTFAYMIEGMLTARRASSSTLQNAAPSLSPSTPAPLTWRPVAMGFFITILAAGTWFLQLPSGLAALSNVFPAYLDAWVNPTSVSPLILLVSLLVYQPLALIFGSLRALRVLRSGPAWEVRLVLSAWLSLLLILVLPARQPLELVWVLLPLWVLAARQLAAFLPLPAAERTPVWLTAVIVFILLLVCWLNLGSYLTDANRIRLIFSAGLLIAGLLAVFLIGLGWSLLRSTQGAAWGFTAACILFLAGMSFQPAGLRPVRAVDLWQPEPVPGDVALLVDTLSDLSEWNSGRRDSLDIVAIRPDPALRWALRGFPHAEFQAEAGGSALPSVIVAPAELTQPEQSISYRGQPFEWSLTPDWAAVRGLEALRWLYYRNTPVVSGLYTVWARSDVFPGGNLLSTAPAAPAPLPDEDEIIPELP